MQLEAGNL